MCKIVSAQVVSHEHVNKSDYCTISSKGVARMRNDDEVEFVPLNRWEHEYKNFKKLIQVCGWLVHIAS